MIDVNLIYALIPIILTLILIEFFFKNRFETKKTLNLVRWVIIIYTLITLIGFLQNPEAFAFANRTIGTYAVAYWILLLSALILPFTLLNNRLGSKFWYVLLIAFCIKTGVYYERFVINATSFHRDYLTESGNPDFTNSFLFGIAMLFLQGVIIAVLVLGVFELIKNGKPAYRCVYTVLADTVYVLACFSKTSDTLDKKHRELIKSQFKSL